MKKIFTTIAIIASIILYMLGVIFWLQADKEVDFLCNYFEPGMEVEKVQAFLNTIVLSHAAEAENTIEVKSVYLANSVCSIQLDGYVVSSLSFSQAVDAGLIFGVIGIALLIALIIFQLFLAAGKPWGEFAWGGQHRVLPNSLRVGSVVSSIILVYAILVMLNGAGLVHFLPEKLTHDSLVVFFVLFGLSALGNSVSKSEKERKTMTFPAILLFLSVFTVMASMW